MKGNNLDELCINSIRFLAVDAVEKAKSGHPGLPLDSAPMTYVLWDRFLRYNPENPDWPNRDRYILSAGHGCAMLYAMLYLTGYEVSLDDLKQFRQWDSITPGHPEYRRTPGVDTTTGPLGQGFANSVGMAIAESALAARFNKPGFDIIDHYTFVEVSDGDLMEGISSEAASIAGHLKLGKLIVFYDDNNISIDGNTSITFTENRRARFEAFGWHTELVEDANDIDAIARAIEKAKQVTDRPSFIDIHSHIGYGSPNKQDTAKAHGEPLGAEEAKLTKQNLGWPVEPAFYVPDEALKHFRKAIDRGNKLQKEWENMFGEYSKQYPDLAGEFMRVMQQRLPKDWDSDLPFFKEADGPMATRSVSPKFLEKVSSKLPELMGGAADLAASTYTIIKDAGDYQPGNRSGRNIHFGIREHSMGAILNGMASHKGFIPYGSTFLIFSDYMRPPMRLAALSKWHVLYIFTHDSVGLGEDGPTHQPIEQLLGLRSIPQFVVIRPADANETTLAWKLAIEQQNRPVALALSRQKLPVLDMAKYPNMKKGFAKGAYVISEESGNGATAGSSPDLVFIATGSEVHLAIEAKEQLAKEGVNARVVSMPSWNIFHEQSQRYQDDVIPPEIPLLAIEAGTTLGWKPYAGPSIDVIGIDHFGSSAPGDTVLKKMGFNVKNVVKHAHSVLKKTELNKTGVKQNGK